MCVMAAAISFHFRRSRDRLNTHASSVNLQGLLQISLGMAFLGFFNDVLGNFVLLMLLGYAMTGARRPLLERMKRRFVAGPRNGGIREVPIDNCEQERSVDRAVAWCCGRRPGTERGEAFLFF